MTTENKILYTVQEKIKETHDTVTLQLSCDEKISYKAGQFINIFLKDSSIAEGKSYTVSSAPLEDVFQITVRDAGPFSHALCSMSIGDTFFGTTPYGYFYNESDTSTLVMIAGGVGVTPFRSMIVDALKKNPARKIILFYSNKTVSDNIFKNEFEKLQQEYKNFVVKNYITREEIVTNGFQKGRVQVSDILQEIENVKDKEILICGGIVFVRDFWKGLQNCGVDEDCIYTEAFF